MNAQGQLSELLDDWRGLTAAESQAIRTLDWPRLEECQEAKKRLMSQIEGLENIPELLPRVKELLALERHNECDLQAMRANLEAERAGVDRASRAMRQVSKAYGGRSSANWQSYS